MTRDELYQLSRDRFRKTWRGKDIRKMTIPWTERDVLFTCSNGFTIEVIHQDDFWLEGLFMGHCLGGVQAGSVRRGYFLSLRSEGGKPHVTIDMNYGGCYCVGRCNAQPPEKYMKLIREHLPEARPQTSWDKIDNDRYYHEQGILTDRDYRDMKRGDIYRDDAYVEKRGLAA